ncbi:hypothetical protein O53_2719 [Microcystis aeruginosa TAIHU98]|uniref:Uncharacterized protein n=1 Tax=Microcystis aeruginosa TAIHU98 TaxID=1134457 RepID=L7E5I3_MICAE|nr:hypothetical protein [Microcystis aeruginosa]ELP53908.1 hypothetical protein O53_2719 [Microcystis aeruginosa TAIHU98]
MPPYRTIPSNEEPQKLIIQELSCSPSKLPQKSSALINPTKS